MGGFTKVSILYFRRVGRMWLESFLAVVMIAALLIVGIAFVGWLVLSD